MIRTATLIVVAIVALAAMPSLRAQTQTVDLSTLGIGVVSMPQAIEVDGNAATQEWLLTQVQLFNPERRVVKITATGQMCVGPAFVLDLSWTLQLVGGRHVLTRFAWPLFEIRSLSPYVPSC